MKQSEIFNENKSIVFIGFMGVGKTTVAQLVAQKLNRPFVDIDDEIEKHFNMPTTKIFEQFGEKVFRDKENEICLEQCKQPGKVISLGGGAFMQAAIREACLNNSIVVYLDITWDAWKERIDLLIDSRPILQQKSLEEVETLFAERKTIYENNHFRIVTDQYTPEQIAAKIITTIHQETVS